MARNYRNGATAYVPLEGFANHNYVFTSRNSAADRTALGQTLLTTAVTSVNGFILGCNAPKPGRATKKTATGSESGFYDPAKRAALIAANWTLSKGKPGRSPSQSSKSDFVYVSINGVKYAWYCPRVEGEAGINTVAAGLGVTKVDANDLVVYGCKFPRPPRLKTVIEGKGTYSTFYDPSSTTIPATVETQSGSYSLGDLLTYIKVDSEATPPG